jgi:hypothetical protein
MATGISEEGGLVLISPSTAFYFLEELLLSVRLLVLFLTTHISDFLVVDTSEERGWDERIIGSNLITEVLKLARQVMKKEAQTPMVGHTSQARISVFV